MNAHVCREIISAFSYIFPMMTRRIVCSYETKQLNTCLSVHNDSLDHTSVCGTIQSGLNI